MLISVGWLPPYLCPSRRLLRSRDEGRSLVTRSEVTPIPGPRLVRWFEITINRFEFHWCRRSAPSARGRPRAGDRPGERRLFPCDGRDDLFDVLAARCRSRADGA